MADVEVGSGGDAVFEVCVAGEPELDWYKDGVFIEDEGRFVIEDPLEGEDLYRLTIEQCVPEDSGTYTCLIKNDQGETKCSAVLLIKGTPLQEVVARPEKITEAFASTERPGLDSGGRSLKPAGKITKDDPTRQATTKLDLVSGKATPVEFVLPVGEKIPSEVKKAKETAKSAKTNREAQTKPKFLTTMKNSNVNEGESIVFEVEAKDGPFVDWYKDGNLLDDGGRIIIEDAIEGNTLYRLTVKDSAPDDGGHYKCVAFNDAGETFCSAHVEIKKDESPPEFVGATVDTTLDVPEGQDGRICVEVRGKPDTRITWFKNGLKIRGDLHVDIGKKGGEYFICVNKMTKSDSGVYKCVATSAGGSVSKEFQVNVVGELSVRCLCFAGNVS